MPTTVVANDKADDHDDDSSGGGNVRVGLLSQRLFQSSCRVLHFFTRSKRFLAVSLFSFTNQHVSLRLAWILQNLVEVQKAIEEDNCCFGTIDTWLLHKLTKGSVFATDFSNASATGLFDPFKVKLFFFFPLLNH